MKKLLILGNVALAAAMMSTARADINQPDATGYFERGVAMFNDRNYNGCIDQLLQMRQLNASALESEEALYYMAMATQYCGDDEAIDLLRDFCLRYPQSPRYQDVLMSQGDYFFTRGNYGEALSIYDTVAPRALTDSRADDLTYRRAYSLMMLGQLDQANRLFDSLATTKAYGNAATFYKGYIAYCKHDYTTARQLLNATRQDVEPGTAAPYYLAQIEFLDGNYSKAADMARKALAANPGEDFTPELNRIAGESLYNLGRPVEAIPYLQRYVDSSDQPRPTACYILGVSEYEAARYGRAIEVLQRATVGEDVTAQSAYLYLGQCYVKTGDTNAAILAFDKSYKMGFDDKTSETALYNYIAARTDGGRMPFAKSAQLLEEFLNRYPGSSHAAEVSESLVSGYLASDNYQAALDAIDRVKKPTARLLQQRQQVLVALGANEYSTGQTEQALRHFVDAIDQRGGSATVARQARLWAANCRYDLGNYDDAADDYLAFLNSAPADDVNRPCCYYNLGYTRMAQQRWADAYKDFARVMDNTDLDKRLRTDALNRAADCLYAQHQFGEASKLYLRAYDMLPAEGDYPLYRQAEMFGYNRDYNSRLKTLDKMMRQFPNSALVPDALLAKAESHTLLGQPDKAIATYQQLVTDYPSTAQGRAAALSLAVTRLNTGDRSGAIEAYRDVIANYPTSPQARVALDDLKELYAANGQLAEYVNFVNSVPELPGIDVSQLEETAFTAAESKYTDSDDASLLRAYIEQYPTGSNMPKALLMLAEDAEESGNTPQAVAYASRLVAEYPDCDQAEEALLIKADGEAAQGKGETAYATYATLVDRASTAQMLNDALVGQMTTAVELGRYADLIGITDRLLATSAAGSERSQVMFYRALALDRTGHADRAREIWSQLAAEPSTLQGSKSAVYLIESLVADKRYDEAAKQANAFIDAGSPHNYWYARGFIAYSDALRGQGKEFEANEYLKALQTNYPGTEADIFQMIETRLSK